MLFCHKIHYIFMINALFLQNFVASIYALFPTIFLSWKVVSANFSAFWVYAWKQEMLAHLKMLSHLPDQLFFPLLQNSNLKCFIPAKI